MLARKDNELLYFSTKVELKIDGVIFRPSICYKVPPFARVSLEKNKNVTFYPKQVRFVNGVVAPILNEKKKDVPSFVKDDGEVTTSKRKRKK